MERSQIETVLREIIGKRLPNVDSAAIAMNQELADFGIDSLTLNWICADMEDAFEFIMSGADIIHLKTLETAVAYVEKRIS